MTDLHFIECRFTIQGRKWQGFVERDCDRLGLSNTVSDILSGQVEGVRKVYRADLETKSFHDVSEEVAAEIMFQLGEANAEPTGEVLDYLEEHLGCRAVAEFTREAAQ